MAPPFKLCCNCRRTQVSENFGNDKTRKDGKSRECKSCAAERSRQWRQKHGNMRRKRLRAQYNMSVQDYEEMFARQGGGCWICGAVPGDGKHLDIDHDHQTNKVRGLLCNRCNRGLAIFKDSIELLGRALGYLNIAGTPQPERTLRHDWKAAREPYEIVRSTLNEAS